MKPVPTRKLSSVFSIIHVRRQVRPGRLAPVKDGDEREVGVQQDLQPILAAWKLNTKHLQGALKRMKLVMRDAEGANLT